MADLLVCGECDGIEGVHRAWCRCFQPAGVDPRDAEIARLKAEVADTRAELGRAMLTGREIEHENSRLRAALAEYEEHHGVERLIANVTAGQDAEIARLKAEVEKQSHAAQGPHDRECNCSICDSRERHENRAEIAALKAEAWGLRVTADEAIVEHLVARKEVERLREYERLHGVRSNEIGALRAEVAMLLASADADAYLLTQATRENNRLRAALAAGPAALRKMAADYDRKVINGTVPSSAAQSSILRSADLINAAMHVEAAQEAAMKEEP